MKRRGFFGAMAGIFGAPVAVAAASMASEANDVFGEKGKLVELPPISPKPMPIERGYSYGEAFTRASGVWASSVTAGVSTYARPAVYCEYCSAYLPISRGQCERCGAPIRRRRHG